MRLTANIWEYLFNTGQNNKDMLRYIEEVCEGDDISMLEVPNEEYLHLKLIWDAIEPFIDEKMRRIYAGAIAKVYGHGGNDLSFSVTGLRKQSIKNGVDLLNGKIEYQQELQRKKGGGRKKITEIYPAVTEELGKLIEDATKGDPESPLLWTNKSTRKLAEELSEKGMPVSYSVVGDLLSEMGYSLQANKKTMEGGTHPDRNIQFEYINKQVCAFQDENQPVISVDTKKKELIGDYKNNGKEYAPKGSPIEVNVYDFVDKDKGKAVPYGVYDISKNNGYVAVGTSYDTAEFAVSTIRGWWNNIGKELYPESTKLLITADGGGSNGSRVKLWKYELHKFGIESGLAITVCHFPPGTSKWNKIEHQLFSQISINWRGRPLTSVETIVSLIGSTKTRKGLVVNSVIDTKKYEKGRIIRDDEFNELNIKRHEFHGDWNYSLNHN